jgi:tetratricopeptide (TPR) repeat protein
MAEGAAEYAFKNAKANSDFSDAAKQYEKALLLAPWLAADYFNGGVAHEKAGENKAAIASFSLYLLAAPNADDTLAVKKRIGGLQYAAQKAVEDANNPALQQETFLKSLDGGTWQVVSNYAHNFNNGSDWGEKPMDPEVFIRLETIYLPRHSVIGCLKHKASSKGPGSQSQSARMDNPS